MKRQVNILDSLRAFAALSVCLFHFVVTTKGYVTDTDIKGIFKFGQFGVQMFFVISGFVIPWSMYYGGYKLRNFFSFLFKRLSRLEPPYIVSIFLVLAVLFLRENILGKTNHHIEVSKEQVFLHFGYLIPFFDGYQWLNQVYWTLAVEFQFYLVMAFIFIPLVSFGLYGRVAMFVFLLSVSFIGDSRFLPCWLPLFLLGVLVFLLKSEIIGRREFIAFLTVVLGFCIVRFRVAEVIYSVLPVLFIVFFEEKKIPGLHTLGTFSYSFYLVHPLIGASLINVLSWRFSEPYEKIMVIVAGVAVSLLSSWIMYLLIERPSKRLSASVKYNKTRVRAHDETINASTETSDL